MASVKPKSKLAYLSYDQIQPRIDSGQLDQYDLIYEKSQHLLYIIDKDMNIVPITSRIDSYQSEASAIEALNSKTDTYEGQIVNILVDGKYIPYSVNKDSSAVVNTYYVTRIGIDDYNDLKNKPVENIVTDTEILLSDLDDGFYTLIGSYRFCNLDQTHRMTSIKKYFIINSLLDDNNNTITHITEINGTSITKYICSVDSFVEDRYVLASELGNDVSDILDVELPGRLDDYVQQNQATQQDIQNLFS